MLIEERHTNLTPSLCLCCVWLMGIISAVQVNLISDSTCPTPVITVTTASSRTKPCKYTKTRTTTGKRKRQEVNVCVKYICVCFWGCVLPVSSTRAHKQENAGMSRLRPCRWALKSRMESSHSPKPRRHCSRCRTRPVQNTNFSSASKDLGKRERERGLDEELLLFIQLQGAVWSHEFSCLLSSFN